MIVVDVFGEGCCGPSGTASRPLDAPGPTEGGWGIAVTTRTDDRAGRSHDDVRVRVADIAIAQGRRPVQWSEVYDHFKTKLDKKTIVHIWKS